MRVVAGSARGRRLEYKKEEGIRPTTDKVKESLFNAIQFEVPGAVVLDLFAGSGQMGVEALSRGAERAVFVDSDAEAQKIITQNLKATGLLERSQVLHMDSHRFLQETPEKFDIALLDPPYHKEMLQEVLPLLVLRMTKNSVILCEHWRDELLPERVVDFVVRKRYNYGKICITAYHRVTEEESESGE